MATSNSKRDDLGIGDSNVLGMTFASIRRAANCNAEHGLRRNENNQVSNAQENNQLCHAGRRFGRRVA
jgi:hypothetical protein